MTAAATFLLDETAAWPNLGVRRLVLAARLPLQPMQVLTTAALASETVRQMAGRRKSARRQLRARQSELAATFRRREAEDRTARKARRRKRRERRLNDRLRATAEWRRWYAKHGRFGL